MKFSYLRSKDQQKNDDYPDGLTVVDQKVAHTYKFIFKYEVFFALYSSEHSYFHISLFFISNGIFFGLELFHGIIKYLFIALVLLYIYLVFIYIERCILQFLEDIGQYELTTMLRAYVYMLVSILFYTVATYKTGNIEDYIFIVLAIVEISFLYYKKRNITKGYAKFPVVQFTYQKNLDFIYGSEIFPELKIQKKRLVKSLLSFLFLTVTVIFFAIIVMLGSLYGV